MLNNKDTYSKESASHINQANHIVMRLLEYVNCVMILIADHVILQVLIVNNVTLTIIYCLVNVMRVNLTIPIVINLHYFVSFVNLIANHVIKI